MNLFNTTVAAQWKPLQQIWFAVFSAYPIKHSYPLAIFKPLCRHFYLDVPPSYFLGSTDHAVPGRELLGGGAVWLTAAGATREFTGCEGGEIPTKNRYVWD